MCSPPPCANHEIQRGLFTIIFTFVFLLGSGKAEAPDIPPPAPVTQPVATLACVTASLRVPAQLAVPAKSGTNCRPDWPTVTLREYSYHPSTLALSRAKVRLLASDGQQHESTLYIEFIGFDAPDSETMGSWGAAPHHHFGVVFTAGGEKATKSGQCH